MIAKRGGAAGFDFEAIRLYYAGAKRESIPEVSGRCDDGTLACLAVYDLDAFNREAFALYHINYTVFAYGGILEGYVEIYVRQIVIVVVA